MNLSKILASTTAVLLINACGNESVADQPTSSSTEPAEVAVQEQDDKNSSETTEPEVDLSGAPSGAYMADQGHRYIAFTYDHQGFSKPQLRWAEWDAELNWNAENPEDSTVSVTIDATSIDSGVEAFDKHLKSADFFEVEKFPTITFVSTDIETTGPNTGKITGDLTIKNITKSVSMDATFNKGAYNQRAEAHKIGFSATTTILRSDFDVDLAVPFVGDEVSVVIEVEFDETSPATAE